MARDPEQFAHQEWLGYVQPVGLVVSIPALLHAQAHVQRNTAVEHQRFLACLPRDKQDEIIPEIRDFPEFTRSVLGWEAGDLLGAPGGEPLPSSLEATLPGYNETLRPTYAVREFQPQDASRPWMMLINSLPVGTELDALSHDEGSHWQATPHAKFERLLRETQVPFGLLINGTHLRLVYAPRGETSGYATFSVADMAKVAGRPIFAALHMLLNVERLFSLPEKQRLPAILADSRKYQNVVSTKLAEQVLAALYELVRGFQAADEQRRGELLREVLAADPNHVYAGLLTVLLRLVFTLYAEDRGLLSSDPVYSNFYSITGLFERLRSDAGRYPDTMDQRYGAWAQLLTLFRMVYDGGQHGGLKIPARRGYLFDPDRYNFLEGRPWKTPHREGKKVDVPRVADGVIYRVLEKLLILDGERLSYRTLDVEQIGSVYETMMGFNLEVAQGRSIAIKPTKAHGAPTSINLDELVAIKPADRVKWIAEKSDQKLTGQAAEAIKAATSIEALLEGLDKKIAHDATPNVVPRGAMVLQPSDERRRSGSHYTPRSLTEPIGRTTLKPILEQLGEQPKPEQILALNVCDPAMGSGAFLVEACRQLGDALVDAWHVHDCLPALPPDEDEVLHARRLIAQQCLYGVDKNPMAVDLSKLSLWLATLAKEHPFTFLDHSLRAGDSLVGLTREQIAAFHWQPPAKRAKDDVWFGDPIAAKMKTVTEYRQRILASRDDKPYEQLRRELDVADEALSLARLTGDLVIAAYFSASKDKDRKKTLHELGRQLVKYIGPQGKVEDRQPLTEAVAALHGGNILITPFHWHIEFPEVFTFDAKGTQTGGFDAIVGNPPFLGGKNIAQVLGDTYLSSLKSLVNANKGSIDLAAYFLHRMSQLVRPNGAFGLIATMALIKGGTREGGLGNLIENGHEIISATFPRMWPGAAAVHFITLVLVKGTFMTQRYLDGAPVDYIHSDLKVRREAEQPTELSPALVWSRGTTFLGEGFMLSEEQRDELLSLDPSSAKVIRKLMGGNDLVTTPTIRPSRYVIDFGDMTQREAQGYKGAFSHIVETVKPQRDRLTRQIHEDCFWKHWDKRKDLYDALKSIPRALAFSMVTKYVVYGVVDEPCDIVFSDRLGVLANASFGLFATMQSRVNESWVIEHSNRRGETLQISISASLGTFPFPATFETDQNLEAAGVEYCEFRKRLLAKNDEGLTDTYNRFHDPSEAQPSILKLRELHAAMDRAVLEAYGWHDLAETAACEFLLDYEEEEDEDQPSAGKKSKKKKPWRYRWPDDFRDEVLARLLALNAQRAEQERLTGKAAASDDKPKRKRATKKGSQAKELF